MSFQRRRSLWWGAVALAVFLTLPGSSASVAEPTQYYHPNYEISADWNTLIEQLIVIESTIKISGSAQSVNFGQLAWIFERIFPYFPQEPEQRILYEQCKMITKALGTQFTTNDYYIFKDKCFSPLQDLIRAINTKYTVVPKIVANPKQGSAPLNVTFDARTSVDPSNDTVPSDNFFRYYKDVQGVEQFMGKWPVINYTFPDPGNHIVHLTVRSVNNTTQGIFDGEASIAINVAPKAATLVVYVNGKKLDVDDILKIGTQDAQDGLVIDGSATTPLGERTILQHTWTIVGEKQQQQPWTNTQEGPPELFVYNFPSNGVYSISLETVDNENNKVKETYKISVSDPVAHIKYAPEQWSTATTYTFDGSASYSLTSRVKKMQWTIIDPQGNLSDTVTTKIITKKFPVPGIYTVRLTVTDTLGNESYDIQQVTVQSTPPVPTFSITPTSDREKPSRFVLDASATFDADLTNGADALEYIWNFSVPDGVTLEQVDSENKQVTVMFDVPGKHTIQLAVEDSYGQRSEISKDIVIDSTLRPIVNINPLVSRWWEPVEFTVQTNKDVSFYQWNYGDGVTEQLKSPQSTHTYTKAWIYELSLTVATADGQENTISKQLFVGEQGEPVIAYEVKGNAGTVLTPDGSCAGGSGEEDAYVVDRYETIIIDGGLSKNTQWNSSALVVQYHPQNDDIYTKKLFTYNFPLLGCQSMDMFLEDTNAGKTIKKTLRFDVRNALPKIEHVLLDFPQPGGGNSVGVGVNTKITSQREIFSDTSIDPIVVNVSAKGVRDPDGIISHFIWYYYPSQDPDRIISLKVTPANVPQTTFVVPKPYSPMEYAFGVRVIDNDGGEISSEQLLGKWPIVFFPPGEGNFDIPAVTFKSNATTIKVGQAVTFTAQANLLSNKPDFAWARYFKYDFEGDGKIDLTTKQDVVTYAYQLPGEYKPKVNVYYRGRAGVGNAEKIVVQKWLNPSFLHASLDKKVLIKQMSAGAVERETLCMDIRLCREKPERIFEEDVFLFEYPDYGDYFLQQTVMDEYGNEEIRKEKITLTQNPTPGFALLSLPEGKLDTTWSGSYNVAVGSVLKNTIVRYVSAPGGGCYVDKDITIDTDGDGDPAMDNDFACNQVVTLTYTPTAPTTQARAYYVQDGVIKEQSITISFIDFEKVTDEEYKRAYDMLHDLIEEAEQLPTNEVLAFYKDLLLNLQNSLGEKDEMSSLIIQIRDLVSAQPSLLPDAHVQRLTTLLTALADSTVQSVFGGTAYEKAKGSVIAWFGPERKQSVIDQFAQFEAAEGNQSAMKLALNYIFTAADEERTAGNIDEVDFADIQKQLCIIVNYFDLPSKTCGTEVQRPDATSDDAPTKAPTSGSTSVLGKIVKVVLWIVVVLAVLFGVIIVIFAIKAKRQAKAQNEQLDGKDQTE